ncbi:ribulose-1,5-bisphosphate carboxylase/oxygenase large subunit [Methylocella silvestris BL2]|uniref:Ribulose-1,5-bisphosphate carboxylase/oxygenase large subunit n=1 Tax=Methylocella silvestris (strain DSM 15510 / CIP 108128 / LMG 27833 / NCIMB 13906 / BL2) TaxID=395965 RepID=B8EPK8_METSB|nr:RuBisCO large subunit C-terminal-like domain-containing protein [Methylocella silvestris]ACK50213.1 ribulose-1,5-bisphosphate carboxylase/oxygenase large subunit [Methylocella silvestris BL2]
MSGWITAVYRLRAGAAEVEARAEAIALEQSVEAPLAAVRDDFVRENIVGRVAAIEDCGGGWFEARIELAAATIGYDAGQLLNMLFGNSSLLEDVLLVDAILPAPLAAAFGGPSHGLAALRAEAGASGRALTCSALKPQGVPAAELAELAFALSMGGLDFLKDDHGLADQTYSRFEARIAACAAAVRKARDRTGGRTRYAPSLSGSYPQMRQQLLAARGEGLDAALIAPMIAGCSNFQALRVEFPDFAFLAHPTMTGRAISPVLFARLFRLFGADVAIFPNYGGRFGYSPAVCEAIAAALLSGDDGLKPSIPAPAGGMSVERTPELLDRYGRDVMLLIGGALLSAPREALTEQTRRFVEAVASHHYR